jgi:hypothetical protein
MMRLTMTTMVSTAAMTLMQVRHRPYRRLRWRCPPQRL